MSLLFPEQELGWSGGWRHGRDQLQAHLKAKGIEAEVYYPVPIHRQECFHGLGYLEGDFPEAERACRELLALPIYPELNDDQQHYVVQAVREWFERRGLARGCREPLRKI